MRRGDLELDLRPAIERVYEAYLTGPDTLEVVPSYWLGQVGILLILWRMTGSSRAPDLLETQIRANIPNPTLEALWAAPGTMLGAWRMWTWTGEERWRALYLENVEQMWQIWQYLAEAHCYLWTQDLYGKVAPLLGAGHGFAGNVYALLQGASLLSDERRQTLFDRCLETLQATARLEGACANWPPGIGQAPGHSKVLVQWCHGAPGMVTGCRRWPRANVRSSMHSC